MSTPTGLLDAAPGSTQPTNQNLPFRSLVILAIIVFFAELIVMVILFFLDLPSYLVETLLDGTLMVVLIMPGLYYLQLKPLLNQIQERQRAESALRANESLLKNVLSTLPIGVWIIDKTGQITHGNPATQQIWKGLRYVGIQGYAEFKGWWLESGERIQPDQWAATRAISRGETSLNEEIEIENFIGERKIILNSAVPIIDEQAVIQGAIVVNQDITQRRQAQKAMMRTNELLERIFSSISTLIAYMDRDFNFIRVNDTYARSAGHPPEFFTGRNHFELYPHAENQTIFQRVVETGEPYVVLEKPFEYPEYPERGITYWDWSLQPVKTPGGEVEGVVLSLVDVSERKRAELQLERQNEELRQLYQVESTARQSAETLSAAAHALTMTLDLDQVFNTLIDHIHAIVPSDTIGVTLLEDEHRLAVRALRGFGAWAEQEPLQSISIDGITDSLIRRLNSDRRSITIPSLDIPSLLDENAVAGRIHSWLVVPIIASERVIGLAEIGRANPEPFTPGELLWVEALVSQAAVAIQNAWLFEQVRSSSERLQNLARKLVEIQENERVTISRELHDEAGQALSSMKLSLHQLELDPDCPPQVRQQLAALKDVADGVLEGLHHLAVDLRPVTLDRLGLVAALDQLAYTRQTEWLSIRFKALGFSRERLPKDIETALYRIVQEAITNVVRHAQASTVGILLERIDNLVKVFVEDDGVGFEAELPSEQEQLGLVGMRERAEMLGGTLTIESAPGKGTAIIVEVPLGHSDSSRG